MRGTKKIVLQGNKASSKTDRAQISFCGCSTFIIANVGTTLVAGVGAKAGASTGATADAGVAAGVGVVDQSEVHHSSNELSEWQMASAESDLSDPSVMDLDSC